MDEEFDSPADCEYCGEVFDTAEHFITKPYRAVCPHCGEVQPSAERDWKSYAGF